MNKSEAKFAATSANLIAEFVRNADSTMLDEFCSRFEIEMQGKHRKKAEEMAMKLGEEFLSPKEAQKSRSSSVNKDSPPTAAQVGVFGSKSGSKQYVIDEMLATGEHTLAEIENESGASIETVKRRIRKLKSDGYGAAVNGDDKIGVFPLSGWSSAVGITEKGEERGKKRKRKRKK